MNNLKRYFLFFAVVLLFATSNLWGRVEIERAMREFQARYYWMYEEFYSWPDCYGGPAPAYPKDGFYGEDIAEDPYMGVILVSALKNAFFYKPYGKSELYSYFLNLESANDLEGTTNYPDMVFTADDFSFPEVSTNNYLTIFKQLDRSIKKFNFLPESPGYFVGNDTNSLPLTKGCGISDGSSTGCVFSQLKNYVITNYPSCEPYFSQSFIGIEIYAGHTHHTNSSSCFSGVSYHTTQGKFYWPWEQSGYSYKLFSTNSTIYIYLMTQTYEDGLCGELSSGLIADGKYHLFTSFNGGEDYLSDPIGFLPDEISSSDIPSASLNQPYTKGWYIDEGMTYAIYQPHWDTTADDIDCCVCSSEGSCSFGSVQYSENQSGKLQFQFNTGQGSDGKSVMTLYCSEKVPSERLFTPSGLQMNSPYYLWITQSYLPNYEQSIDLPQGSIIITNLSENGYRLLFKNNNNVLLKTVSIQKGTNGLNQLLLSETTDLSSRTNLFNYNPTNSSWSRRVIGSSVETVRSSSWSNEYQIDSIRNYDGTQLISQTTETFKLYPWGKELIKRERGSTNDVLLTETWEYYTDAEGTNAHQYGNLALYTDEKGFWERYLYDAEGRITNRVIPTHSNSSTTTDSVNRVVKTLYSATPPQITEITTWRNNEIARTYRSMVYTDQGMIAYETNIVCQTPGASVSDPNNLVTITCYDVDQYEIDQSLPLKVKWILHPDGTGEVYEYETQFDNYGSYFTSKETLSEGQGQINSQGSLQIVPGTCRKSETYFNSFGQTLSNLVSFIPQNGASIQLSYTTNGFDKFGKVCLTRYMDGTTITRSNVYCGVKWEKNREGVVTYYDYDAMRRLVKTTVNGVCTSNLLNADGNILMQIKFPTNNYASRITSFSASYDSAGRKRFETNAVGTVTAYNYYLEGVYWCEEQIEGYGTNLSLTNKTRYYKDGNIYQTLLNGTINTVYQYGIGLSGTNEFGVNPYECYTYVLRPSGYGTEVVRTYTDMVGRKHKVQYSSSYDQQYYYNEKNQLVRSRDADGVQILYQYNGLGEREYTVIDMNRNNVIDFAGTDRITQHVRSVTNAHGANVIREEVYQWANNNVNSSRKVSTTDTRTDGLVSWQIIWNGSASVTNKIETEYPSSGSISRRETETRPDGTKLIREYESGRLVRVIKKGTDNEILVQKSYGYDNFGRQNTVTDLRNGTSTTVYDNADRVISVTTCAPEVQESPQTTSYSYDGLGRVTEVTYADGSSVQNTYNSRGFLVLTRGSQTYPVGYSYDNLGRVKTMTNWTSYPSSGVNVTTWAYSNRGFLARKTYADGNYVAYTYTPAGRLATRLWARKPDGVNSLMTTYSYNNAGEQSSITYSDNTPSVEKTYNRLGELTGVSHNGITTTFSYNAAGYPIGESYSGGLLSGLSVSKSYDNKLRPIQVRVPNFITNAFAYDGISGRLASVTHGGYSAHYSYMDHSDLWNQLSFKQGSVTRMTTEKTYDKLNRLKSITSTPSGSGQLPFAYAASYNNLNQRIQTTLDDGSYWIYEYDNFGQLVYANKYFVDGTLIPGQNYGYSHSQIGNRINGGLSNVGLNNVSGISYYYITNSINVNQYTRRLGPNGFGIMGIADADESVSINGEDPTYRRGEYFWKWLSLTNSVSPRWEEVEVISGGETNQGNVFIPGRPEYFSWDEDGNLLSDGRWDYTWDGENRLISMSVNTEVGPQLELDFQYDWMGRRIGKTVKTNGVVAYSRKFVYDGWNLMAELNGSNNAVVRTYTWGLDIRESSQGAGGVAGLLMVNAGSGGIHFPAYDLNGNVMGLVKAANGTISTRYEYGPFGEVFCSVGELAGENPFQFSTKYTDFETDLVYYGYRYYSPDIGRWISRDPIEEQGGFNLYAFVNNDPINKIDTLGLFFCGECKEGDVRNFHTENYVRLWLYPGSRNALKIGEEILSALDIISYLQFTSGIARGVAIGIEKGLAIGIKDGVIGALPESLGNTATFLIDELRYLGVRDQISEKLELIQEALLNNPDQPVCIFLQIKWEMCKRKGGNLSWKKEKLIKEYCGEDGNGYSFERDFYRIMNDIRIQERELYINYLREIRK